MGKRVRRYILSSLVISTKLFGKRLVDSEKPGGEEWLVTSQELEKKIEGRVTITHVVSHIHLLRLSIP
jgi:hypothetical protein